MLLVKKMALVGALGVLISGCGVARRTYSPAPERSSRTVSLHAVSGYAEARASLLQAYREWKGTPYKFGGSGSGGVDCSSLVRIIFDDYFGIELPPTTHTQINAGTSVRRTALTTGDLVFFKTGRKTLHVGIIIRGDEFIHASTSNGVMISRLREHYWNSRYLTARRVMN